MIPNERSPVHEFAHPVPHSSGMVRCDVALEIPSSTLVRYPLHREERQEKLDEGRLVQGAIMGNRQRPFLAKTDRRGSQ